MPRVIHLRNEREGVRSNVAQLNTLQRTPTSFSRAILPRVQSAPVSWLAASYVKVRLPSGRLAATLAQRSRHGVLPRFTHAWRGPRWMYTSPG